MRLNRYQTLAAGDVAAQLPDLSKVDKLVIDGVEIRDFSALQASYDKLSRLDRGTIGRAFDGRAAWVANRADKPPEHPPEIAKAIDEMKPLHGPRSFFRGLSAKFFGTRLGQWLDKFFKSDPEAVKTVKNVEIHLKNGNTVTVPMDVTDKRRTLLLQRLSLGVLMVESVPMVPFVGLVVPPAAAAASLVGAAVARVAGDVPLAQALKGMAFKHGMMFTGNALPVVGAAFPATAALSDARQIRDLTA
jgi:hypothetical protein